MRVRLLPAVTVCAVMLVKDEADVIEATLRHLALHVDEILVLDNLSTDGTGGILGALVDELPLRVTVDSEVGYYQSEKTTALALEALERGHRWVIPCDADEIWLSPDGRRLGDWLDGLGRETQFVKAAIYNHVATALDPPEECPRCDSTGQAPISVSVDQEEGSTPRLVVCSLCQGRVEPNPVRRIGWRQRNYLEMRWGKVACRCRPDLVIHQGNHSASTSGVGTTAHGLSIRHFPYRSEEQFIRKALNGAAAYRATDLDEGIGAHWRIYGRTILEQGEDAGRAWFRDAFWSEHPDRDDSLVHDPAPVA